MMIAPGRCANAGEVFSHGTKEGFAMAVKTVSTKRRNSIPVAGAIVALAAMMAGCATNYGPLTYAQETHYRRISAWCYSNFGLTTASQEGQDCVERAWVQIPDTDCQVLYGDNSCTEGYWPSYGPSRVRYVAPRRYIQK
jgi:hypothetical protein